MLGGGFLPGRGSHVVIYLIYDGLNVEEVNEEN